MSRLTLWMFLLSTLAIAWPDLAGAPPPNLDNTLAAQRARISEDPRDPVAWNDLGNLLVLADHFAEAEDAYRKALELAPHDSAARFNLGLLLQQQGRPGDAAKELEELISIHPHHAWGHYQLGVALAARKDRSGAIEHYARALAYDPSLSFAEQNPHIIENPLFSEALLRSQRYLEPSASRVPRLYGEPDRIVELMLDLEMAKEKAADSAGAGAEEEAANETGEGGAGEGEAGEGEEGASPAGPGGGAGARFDAAPGVPGPDRSAVPDTPSEREALERLRSVVVGPSQPSPPAAEEGGSRTTTRRPPTTRRATPAPPARGRLGAPPAAGDPRAADEAPPPVRVTPPPPTRSTRYQPGRRSTSQLDLRLLPEDEAPVRYASATTDR